VIKALEPLLKGAAKASYNNLGNIPVFQPNKLSTLLKPFRLVADSELAPNRLVGNRSMLN
jgi:hypothetical protein